MNEIMINPETEIDAALCDICGMGHTNVQVIDKVVRYEGLEAVVPNYRIFVCDACGEATADPESVKRAEPIVCDLHRKGEGMFTSEEIRSIRESLGFSQDDFGVLLGGGKKAFARYENGKVTQARSMDNLLRVLKAYPQALSVLHSEIPSTGVVVATPAYELSSPICIPFPRKSEFVFATPSVSSNLITGDAA